MNRFGKDSQYFGWGVTAFCVLAGCILFYLLLGHLRDVAGVIGSVIEMLSAFIWGFVIAYVLLPLAKWLEERVFAPVNGRIRKRKPGVGGGPRVLAIAVSVAVALAAIMVIVRLIVPTVYTSVENIVLNYNAYVRTLVNLIERLFEDYPELSDQLESMTTNLSRDLLNWVSNEFLPQMGGFLTNLTTGVYLVFRGLLNFFIGVVVACYLMYNRERFSGGVKKVLYSLFGIHRTEQILSVVHFADQAFMGFLTGKVLDSLIIGAITYVACSALKMPYAAFVSVIIGVTNIIPVFGPFIGAVPCTLIILMVQPVKALVFVVLILIIQQVDGNIIGPKILGNRVGISGFWVMFSIVVCGSLFGVPGMIVGVPLFVVLSALGGKLVDMGLKKRGLSTQTAQYVNMDHMDPETGIPVARADGYRRPRTMPRKKKQKSTKSGEE